MNEIALLEPATLILGFLIILKLIIAEFFSVVKLFVKEMKSLLKK